MLARCIRFRLGGWAVTSNMFCKVPLKNKVPVYATTLTAVIGGKQFMGPEARH